MNLRDLPFPQALDVVYVLLLDELDGPRAHVRNAVNDMLMVPLDPEEAEEYQRETWGLHPDQIAQTLATDAMLSDVTYE